MTAYVIVDIEVIGASNETLEGDWQAKRLVILEFPCREKAKNWLNSPEYVPARTAPSTCPKQQGHRGGSVNTSYPGP